MKRIIAKHVTRERLLEVAEATFISSNFQASTALIAKNAFIAHGTIFFHFKNRDDLVLAVVKRLVLRLTDNLYRIYRDCESLETFLTQHFTMVQKEWSLFKALFSGFSNFSGDTKQEIICLLSVINYYLVEAFNRWSDHGYIRTMLWQSVLMYITFLGDYMFDREKISEKFIQALISFLCDNIATQRKKREKEMHEKKKLCMSCSMLLARPEDSPQGGTSQDYCKYCAREDGGPRPFDEVFNTITNFFNEVHGLNEDTARQAAFAVLSKNPAWKEYIKKYY
jgi:AcrR family transcriptional regulator